MKKRSILAVLCAVLIVGATGCTSRNNQSGSSASGAVPEAISRVEEGAQDAASRVEEGVSDLRDDLFGSEHESMDEMDSMPELSEPMIDGSFPDNESASAAMSTDFEEIGALDSQKQGWGPGVQVDDANRPLGATAFQEKYGQHGAYFIAPNTNRVYLTFDEGYENSYTADILDTLKEKDVKAVFFITYPYAKSEPELVRRMVAEGHILGNHSTKHLSFPDMPLEEAAQDILTLHEYVKANYGYEMTLFRPPMGEFSEQTLALLNSLGYKSVFWSFAYRDWEVDNQPITIEALDTITKRAHPGAIYLLHAVSKTNAEVLDQAIDNIRAKGLEFGRFDWA